MENKKVDSRTIRAFVMKQIVLAVDSFRQV